MIILQGKTHRLGGVLSAMLGYTFMEANNMLLPDVNPILQLAVIYPFAMYGSVVSDLDHNWNSSPSKDPVSKGINSILHLSSNVSKVSGKKFSLLNIFDAKHRSWQTHSDVFLLFFIGVVIFLWGDASGSDANSVILKLIMLGLSLGVASHLLLDSLTPEGIWFLIPSIIKKEKVTFRLVPKGEFFITGGPWERLVRVIMWIAISILAIYILYRVSPYRISFNY